MRIGITGASGFIGTALSEQAVARGHEVVAYSRRTSTSSLPQTTELRPLFLENASPLDLNGIDALVHLAGESIFGLWTKEKKRRIRDSRLVLTRQIVEAMRQGPSPRIFLCASGAGYYGDRDDEILNEQSRGGKGFLAEVCRDWEAAAAEASASGVRVVSLRTGMVLGKSGGAWPMLRKLFGAFLGSPLGNGKQWVPWIHLEDQAGIILHALENDACHGPMNLGSPNPVTNAEMTSAIAHALKRPVMPPVPSFMLRLVMRDLAEIALFSQRMTPKAALESGYAFRHLEFGAALATLEGG